MKRALPVAGLLLASLVSSAHAEPTRILVTAFEPFAGRAKNNSFEIAEALASMGAGPDVEITVCKLPVVYDEGAKAAQACFDAMEIKPDAVVSLGEAGCSLRLETAAHNLDETYGLPDNAGNVHTGKKILEDGPKSIGFDLPVQELYCTLPGSDRGGVDVSESPGGFVCNNTAYLLANAFQGTGVQYGFIHTPNASCSDDAADPKKNAAALATMFRGFADYNLTAMGPDHVLPHCSNDARMPTTSDGAITLLEAIGDADDEACTKDFLKRLKERL